MKKGIIIILCLASVGGLPAISLQESIGMARQHNNAVQAEQSSVQSAEWSQKNAFTNFLPKVSFNETTVRLDDDTYDEMNTIYQIPIIDPNGIPTGNSLYLSAAALSGGYYKTTYTSDITVQQPVFNGGKVILGYQLAKLAKNQARLAFTNKLKETDYAVASTYLGLLKLQDLKILSEKSLNSTLSHLEMVQTKYSVEAAKKSDVLQWQVKVQNDRTSVYEIENNLSELAGYWNNLLGTERADLPDRIDVQNYDDEIANFANMKASEIALTLQNFLQEVNQTSPTLQSLNIARKMMKKQHTMAKGNFLPSFNLQYSYQMESDDKLNLDGDDNWNLAAVFSFPIFQSGANFTNLIKAKYDLKKTEYQTDWAKQNYLTAAENVMRKLITKAKTVENNKTAVEFARENNQIIGDLYKQGLVTNSELLDAETMLFSSEMNLTASYYDFILTKYELEKYKDSEEK